ncbi:MAG: hypothetical protein WD795_16470 [Woeseia sp.]
MEEKRYRLCSILLQAATLVAVVIIGNWVQQAIARQSVAAAYVGVAASILLREPKSDADVESSLRCWALALLVEYTPEAAPIPERLRKAMLEGRVVGGVTALGLDGMPRAGRQTTVDPECEPLTP